MGGLPFIARWFDPRQVRTNGAPAQEGEFRDAPFSCLVQAPKERGIPLLRPAELLGGRELDGASVKVLWQPAGKDSARLNENDRSLWIGLGLGRA